MIHPNNKINNQAKMITKAATHRVVHQLTVPSALYNAGANHANTTDKTIHAIIIDTTKYKTQDNNAPVSIFFIMKNIIKKFFYINHRQKLFKNIINIIIFNI